MLTQPSPPPQLVWRSPTNKIMKTGDWICPDEGCETHNRPSDGDNCSGCGTPFKPGTFVVPSRRSQRGRQRLLPPLPPLMTYLKPQLSQLEDLTQRPLLAPKWKDSLVGFVASTKMSKTLVVKIPTTKLVSKYNRRVPWTKTCYAHDEREDAIENDKVRIVPDRARSKLKRWRVAEIISRKKVVDLDE
ncbi:hypothetical protein TeGR_g816 [Tetraparma gracilis]|uniref:30S ribosomal protein S17 n=1 Tax=Tetraparma gracilis TaxID=2962635 RepID=A0ABQ6MXC4_9STRA|nr:hypothetical protein TeGR_g816 [Tetraparma gracilis]